MIYSLFTSKVNTCNATFFTVTLLAILIAMTGCDAPSDNLDVQGESSELENVVTAESMGYEITMNDLGTLDGEGFSYAEAINENGQIVGASYHAHSDRREAVLWEDGEIKPLCNLLNFESESEAISINNNGQILVRLPVQFETGKYYLVEDDKLTPIKGLERARTINDKGQVAGDVDRKAAIWENGEVTTLNDPGIKSSAASFISNSGIIVGSSDDSLNNREPTIWKNGNIIRLGSLSDYATRYGYAYDINENEEVVGYSEDGIDGLDRAFRWEDGKIYDLGILGTFGASIANAINNKGQIVGHSSTGNGGPSYAVLWIDSNMIDLGTLNEEEPTYSIATDINNRGQIVGQSSSLSGETHAVLWEIKKIE